jgi:hypothetical protein
MANPPAHREMADPRFFMIASTARARRREGGAEAYR